MTPGVVSTITVGATTVISGGNTVSCSRTEVCGAPGDPKALRNTALRITIEHKMILSFMVTPFSNPDGVGVHLSSITSREKECYRLFIPQTSSAIKD
jgi:hypothetical protein